MKGKNTHLPVIGGGGKHPGKGNNRSAHIEKARELASKGKGAKSIAKATGISIDEARHIVRAHKESRVKKSSKDILNDKLQDLREMWEKAKLEYAANPTGQTAYAVQMFMSEQRALIEAMAKIESPEDTALALIQKALQPALKSILRDLVAEGRKTRDKCVSVVSTSDQRMEIETSFNDLLILLGRLANDHYSMAAASIVDIMKCRQEDVQRIAIAANKNTVGSNAIDSEIIPFPSDKRKVKN